MSMAQQKTWTVTEYLEFERASETSHEYFDGQVIEMEHTSLRHSLIAAGALASLPAFSVSGGCFGGLNTLRVKVSATGLYTYPDIVVICGTPQLEDRHQDTLLNPTLIVEVLSPSTERYDRGKKFQYYVTLESLQEYVLISQDAPRIERYARQTDNQWLYTAVTGLESSIELPSIGASLRLTDVYRQVNFDEGAAE